jgi:catalase
VVIVAACLILLPDSQGPTGEVISPDEGELTVQIVASATATVNGAHEKMQAVSSAAAPNGIATSAPQPYRRDAHAKTIGCLKATFRVLAPSDPSLRQGLFAAPSEYHAWIRFSNGDPLVRSDKEKDARGMAIKVMGVPGRKLLEDDGLPHAETQDFLLINSPQFIVRNLREYATFSRYAAQGSAFGYFLGGFTPELPQKNWANLANFKEYHLREAFLARKDARAAPDSLLDTQFYSVSAYRLGPDAFVKYSARPCHIASAAAADRGDPNYLRTEMTEHLTHEGACFEFLVQPQMIGKYMPVEDTTIQWKESDSPFVPVARIEIPKQEFAANQEVCENLSFNPWHALPEHKPAGALNRVRKQVYLSVARYRHTMNGQVSQCEPKDWNVIDSGSCEQAANQAGAKR